MNRRRFGKAVAWAAVVGGLALGLGGTPAPAATAFDCDRACLKQMADRYFEALAQHNPASLPLARDVKYTETGRLLKLGEGIWKKASTPTFRMELFDPDTGGVAIHAVLSDGDVPTIMALRLKVQSHLITEVEAILVPKGVAGGFSAPERLTKPSLHFTRKIRPAEQNSRYELIAAADGYFRAFESEGTPDYIRAPGD